MSGAILFGTAFDWTLGKVGDALARRVQARLANRGARHELAGIAVRAVDAAVAVAPELGDILRSEAYTLNVLAPGILSALDTPTEPMAPDPFAAAFLDRFVVPYLRRRTVDDVLTDIFKLQPERLQAAFQALVAALRTGIWQSEHWKDPLRDAAIEETLITVRSVREDVAAIRASVAPIAASDADAQLDAARADAVVGSTALRLWPKRIAGLYLDRPERAALMARIREHPGASTLVIGGAGAGKSSLLSDLTDDLEAAGLTVFAIKADELPADVRTLADVSRALGLAGDIDAEIDALAQSEPVVLVIDQLDAVSDVMDRTSHRMRLMLQLATQWRARGAKSVAPSVHVVVSSRPFEARHDARFAVLGAETIELALPPFERVEALLSDIGIDPKGVPDGLREAVRKPFMLKLFVDLVERRADVGGLLESNLLTAWLTSAQLGGAGDRREVVALLTALAAEMTQTETLWRPADRFDLEYAEAVRRAEACELLLRRDGRLGFAHQSWIDDFQARRFETGDALAGHAWAGQDSLFGRATLLRGLERLRAVDPPAYLQAVDRLLGEARTRRHLRFLVAGFMASANAPLPQEVRWVERLIREDPRLAVHALVRIKDRWRGWRTAMLPVIPLAASTADTRWMATQLTVAEAEVDPASAERLLTQLWGAADQDVYAFEVCWRGGLWSPGVKARLEAFFARQPIDGYAIANYLTDLAEHGRADAAVELLGAYLSGRSVAERVKAKFYEIEKIVDAAPLAFTRLVLPWFIEAVTPPKPPASGARDSYSRARNLEFDWLEDHEEGGLFAALHRALALTAQADPEAFLAMIAPLDEVDVDEVQAMVAEAFAAGGAPLVDAAVAWLLADKRRLQAGVVHLEDENNVGQMSYDYSTRKLLTALAGHLDAAAAGRLRDYIEAWDPYRENVRTGLTAKDRRQWREWSEEARVALLALLPTATLSARRRRQVAEIVATLPKLRGGRGRRMGSFVGSPMSDTQMSRATDDQIFQMIDAVHDQGDYRLSERRRGGLTGGVSQLSQAFAAFAKEQPARALALVRDRFVATRHETCAGAVLRQLGGDEAVDPDELVALIRDLETRGFQSVGWRRDAAWALGEIAFRRGGLADEEIARLESWLDCDPEQVAAQVARQDKQDEENRARSQQTGQRAQPQALLFGRGGDSLTIMPGDNFTALDAIGAGLLRRTPPAHDAWLAFLERHVLRAEDPAIWTTILSRHGWSLWNSDAARVSALFTTLWDRHPRALARKAAHRLWVHRGIVPPDVVGSAVTAWFALGGAKGKQLAGEFAMAADIVDGRNQTLAGLALAARKGVDPDAQRGAVFAAAAAWRETDEAVRAPAHDLLLALAPTATGEIAEALSTAVDQSRSLIPDARTRELLTAIGANEALLKACLNSFFADGLQSLLLSFGFDEAVLDMAERAVDVRIRDKPQRGGLIDQDFVGIAIALQKSDGPQRARAMDLYERLLDADVYGAEKAATDSLKR